jgi:hypothetical protein
LSLTLTTLTLMSVANRVKWGCASCWQKTRVKLAAVGEGGESAEGVSCAGAAP